MIVAQEDTRVTVDGKLLSFDVAPALVQGRTLVPLRTIFESLGAKIEWDGVTKTVTGTKGDTKVILTVDKKTATVNGKTVELEVPGTIIDNRTLVPARFIAEALGANVVWDAGTRTARITSATELKVHFIDVGQADAIFIDFGNYDILIDGGNNEDGQLVVDYLKKLKTDDIEILIATHPHEDHIGGLDDVIKAYKVKTIVDSGYVHSSKTYEDYLDAALEEKENGAEVLKDTDMSFELGGGAKFDVIETGDDFGDNINNYSVLTKLTYKDVKFLFTGDMEKDVESKILNKDIQADILKVGHHGSSTSSGREFLDKVGAKIAVISAGQDNEYGHPHLETLVAIGRSGGNIYSTTKGGPVVITTNGVDYQVQAGQEQVEVIEQNLPGQTTSPNINAGGSGVIIKVIDLKNETVIIENTSDKDVDMTGWKLVSVEGNQTYNFPDGFVLKAKKTVKIASGGGTSELNWTKANIWNNSGDPGELYNSNGDLVSKYPR
jgi:beta-lactamase superfamily II metal-dependent hydrolase